MHPDLELLLKRLKGGQKPDPKSVTDWILDKHRVVGLDDWDTLTEAIKAAYNMTDLQLQATFRPPIFLARDTFEDDFDPLLKKYDITGWPTDYVEYTRGTEGPTAFHFFTAMAVFGAALKRQTFIDQGIYRLWPCVKVMLIGPSGKTKKSTVSKHAVAIGRSAEMLRLLPGSGTSEALMTELATLTKAEGQSCAMLFISELSVFLNKKDYNEGMVQFLTDLFDDPDEMRRRTQKGGSITCKNVAVSAIFCSNEELLLGAVPATALGGGFMSRMVVIFQGGSGRSFPRPTLDSSLGDDLKARLKLNKFVKGQAILTDSARTWFDERYGVITANWPEDERLSPFWERYPDHLLRLGMILSVAQDQEQRDTVRVTDKHLVQADALVKWTTDYLPQVYKALGSTQYGEDRARILRMIRKAGGIVTRAELARKMAHRMGRRMLDEFMESMITEGLVKKEKSHWDGGVEYHLRRLE